MVKVTLSIQKSKLKTQWLRKRSIKKICPTVFRNHLGAKIRWEDFDELGLNDKARRLKSNVLDVLNICAPLKVVPVKKKAKPKPSFALAHLRRKRDNAKKEKKYCKYKKLRNKCNSLTRKETLEANGKRLDNDPTEVWNLIDELGGEEKDETIRLKTGDRYVSEDLVPSLFLDFFIEKVHKLRESLNPNKRDRYLNAKQLAKKLRLRWEAFSFHEVSFKRVRMAIKKVKKSDSRDMDGLSTRILAFCGEVIVPPLTKIINQSIREAKFPEDWKLSRVVPLHKKKCKTDLRNYRPICLVKVP